MFRIVTFLALVLTAHGALSQQIESPQVTASVGRMARLVEPLAPKYHSQTDGFALVDIVRRAAENNGDVRIARLELEKAQARLSYAGVRANPTLEIEQTSGALVAAPGDRETSVGLSVPLDVYGQRRRRIDVARAELTLREAELAARVRDLTGQVFSSYADALSSLRELQVLDDLLELDTQTTRFVQIRVNEGETSPLELNLLQTEVERLRAKRDLAEGRLQTAINKLRFFAGIEYNQPLKLNEGIASARITNLPSTSDIALTTARTSRPEIRVAELEERVASAGLRLVRAQARADFTAYSRYAQGKASYDDPRGAFSQPDRSLTFGVAIGLPIFDRKQSEKAEAAIAIRQAQEKRAFAEAVVRQEIASAFARIDAATRAVNRLETAVLPRSNQNIETIRRVYEIGELKITDLIAEQRRLLDANQDITEALAERYKAQADLFMATGLTLN